jgi:hypothetical protein
MIRTLRLHYIACLENCRQGAEAIMVIQNAEGFLSQFGHRYDSITWLSQIMIPVT